MEVIRSRSHALVQTLRKLASDPALRRELSLCVLPGERLIEDWIRQGAKLNKVLIPARWLAKPESAQTLLRWQIGSHEAGMSADEAAGWFLLEGGLAEGVSGLGFETVPIALASFCEQASLPAGGLEADWLYLDSVQDPGNLGTIIRTAAAFGVQTCVPGPGCADMWSPKTLRAAMGAHRRLDIVAVHEFAALAGCFEGPIRAADAGGQLAHWHDLRSPGLWVLGSEGRGLSPEIRDHPRVIRYAIPMQKQTESLNAAMSQGILLYEQYRQRQGGLSPSDR